MDEILTRAHQLQQEHTPFALATVVRVSRPASARPGAKALVFADGSIEGWVGGSCAQPAVAREGRTRRWPTAPALPGRR
jgi:xanthine dehydrogenase accessory factor